VWVQINYAFYNLVWSKRINNTSKKEKTAIPYRACAVYVVERGGLRTFLNEKSPPSAFEPEPLFFVMGLSLSELEECSEPEAIGGSSRSGDVERETTKKQSPTRDIISLRA